MKELNRYNAILGVNGVKYYTYYTVKRIFHGMDNAGTYFFRRLENAKEFANNDYADNVVKHTVTEKTWKTLCERVCFED